MRRLADTADDFIDWRDGAACRDGDPELFFPEGTAGPALLQTDQAKRVCQSCPVRTPCLDFAQRHGLGFGIWGGVTGEERRALRGARSGAVA
jgi:WhiB family transcriptional regulator, redox-sensing transcriptional regulator